MAHPAASRIAYFGGSFDPPHNGHLAVARAALQTLALDKVLFAPVGLQPLKPDGSSASFEDRVAMTQLAIACDLDAAAFEVSLADAPNPSHKPNYTIDTLSRLRGAFPPETKLYLILGADAFRKLPRWYRAAEIPFAASLIVVSRPKEEITDLKTYIPDTLSLEMLQQSENLIEYRIGNSAGQRAALYLLPNLHFDISATQLREQIHSLPEGDTQSDSRACIAPSVLEYIRQHGLYL